MIPRPSAETPHWYVLCLIYMRSRFLLRLKDLDFTASILWTMWKVSRNLSKAARPLLLFGSGRLLKENATSPVVTKSPQFPGKSLVKASLFDAVSRPNIEVFTDRRQDWEYPLEGARQA
jgi:hypothetical protein